MKSFKQFINEGEFTSGTTTWEVTYKGETVKVKGASKYQVKLAAAEEFGVDAKDKSITDKFKIERYAPNAKK